MAAEGVRFIEYPVGLQAYAMQRAQQDLRLQDIARRHGTQWANALHRRQFVRDIIRTCFPGGMWQVVGENHHDDKGFVLAPMDPRHAEGLVEHVSFSLGETSMHGYDSLDYVLDTPVH
jgi:hypothetical protein